MRVRLREWGWAACGAGVVAATLVAGAPPASASPGVRPTAVSGSVPEIGLTVADGAALRCPRGVTTWSPMIVPAEVAIARGAPNGSLDPRQAANMPDGSSLWYRSLGDLRSGGAMRLDARWTSDGRAGVPITAALRSGTYLLGALCAKPGGGRYTFPLDANGDLIGEWNVVTLTWADGNPEAGTFRFEQPGTSASASAPAPRAASVHTQHGASGGSGGKGWFVIAAAGLLVLAALGVTGARLGRRASAEDK
ncbi:hypothetical protein [Actinomadura litoris]|uniref:hypothetical protein n=1 Tax=Actinomadura litoris TaxID=2678616 RepID=UPI00156582E9|nr:hypothetical protein [Actinomadura litoris]